MTVYAKLLKRINEEGTIHFTLIDPDEYSVERGAEIAEKAEAKGSATIIVGGSGVDVGATDACVKALKKAVKVPVVLFPGNITGISSNADAILYMSLLNSRSNYWLSLAQALSAFTVKNSGLEIIPMGYLVIESGAKTSVEFYGDANAIPRRKPKIAAAFSLAAQYLGMKCVYLEAGSGALYPVPDEMISYVKKSLDIPVIVGGGIRDGKVAYDKAKAGADIIVTGTIFEKSNNIDKMFEEIISGVQKGGKEKLKTFP